MSITKNNFIVVYVNGNSASEEFAQYYASKHDMGILYPSGSSEAQGWTVNGQTVGINCSTTEILLSEGDFDSEVLDPIRGAISSGYLAPRNI